jgi:hypothetical protein
MFYSSYFLSVVDQTLFTLSYIVSLYVTVQAPIAWCPPPPRDSQRVEASISSLLEIIEIIISITKELYVNEKNSDFHQNYIKNLQEILNKKLIDTNLTINDNDNNCKDLLLNILTDVIEIYHYLRYDTAKNKKPYDIFLWKNIPNLNSYFNDKLLIIKENIGKLPLVEDKLKIIDSLV